MTMLTEPMEWHYIAQEETTEIPEGGDQTFKQSSLKDKTFHEVLTTKTAQYIVCKKSKVLTAEMKAFVHWVDRHYNVNEETRSVQTKARTAAAASTGACAHLNVHHKASSARYVKTTCTDCGLQWREERSRPTLPPGECPHARTDHRG